MSTLLCQCRPLAIAAIVLVAVSAASKDLHTIAPHFVLPEVVPLHTEDHSSSSVIMDSSGAMKSTSVLLRREEKVSLLQAESRRQEKRDIYVLAGNNLCDGGGLWKRYELNVVTPGRYEVCAASCDEKDECIGFDQGLTGCNMYTQKAVAAGTWPNVRFNGVDSFPGAGDHDAYAMTPYDLTAGTTAFGTANGFRCFRKTYYKPADSYFWKIGKGVCAGPVGPRGGFWNRYQMTPGNYTACSNACNQRDECIGFDHGTWNKSTGNSANATEKGCHLYTQKAVAGQWPGVDLDNILLGVGNHTKFASTPNDLAAIDDVKAYNVEGDGFCYVKTHWVDVDSYFMVLGSSGCTGGGLWKHYKMTGTTMDACKEKCDAKIECIGLDMTGSDCRLFTKASVDEWTGVTMDGGSAFAGTGSHDVFAPTPFSLSPGDPIADDPNAACLAKTHEDFPHPAMSSFSS